MSGTIRFIMVVLLLAAAPALAETSLPAKALKVYGPGGPHQVLEECADLYRQKHGMEVVVIRALPHELASRLPQDGDIYYGGAEYMLEEFHRRNPGVLSTETAENLHPRRIGIIVRKGNPLNIRGLEDLARDEVDLLDVRLEKMRQFYGPDPDRVGNIRHFVFTGQQGLETWRSAPELDAWVTYKSWHTRLGEEAEFIEIPGDRARRFTPAALTQRTALRREAQEFIDFLKSAEAHRIFRKHGWD